MRRAAVFRIPALAVSAFVAAATVGGAQSPARLHYRIDATLEPDRAVVSGRVTIRIPPAGMVRPAEVRLGLRLSGGRLVEITAVGDSAGRTGPMYPSPDSASLTVPVAAGIGGAVLMADFTTPLDTAALRSFGYHLAMAVSDADAWYPAVLDLPDSLARFRDFDVNLTVPRGTGALVTGALVDSVLSESGVLYRWSAVEVEGAALAAGAGYRVTTVTNGATRVRALAPAAEADRFGRIAAAAAEAAEWYRSTYGFFPVREIGIVPGYRGARGGFPLPQVFMIHRGDLSDPFVRWITAHELAHYYWGLRVLDADERLGWLTLGLGIWTDQLYLARTANRSLAEQWRRLDGDNSIEDFATAQIAGYERRLGLPGPLVDSLPFDYNTLVRHGKGAVGIYLVARALGPDRFVALQRSLLEQYRHRSLSVAEFGRAAAEAGASGAEALLAAWARGDASLDYAVRGTRPVRGERGRYWIVVERTGTIPYPVTVAVVTARGDTVRGRLAGAAALDSVAVSLPGPPGRVLLDPDGELPMRTSDHPDMQRVFLMAEGDAPGSSEFPDRAQAYLARHPDPHLAARLIERLFELGRHDEVYRTAQRFPAAVSCLDRTRCFAAVQVARSLARTGRTAGAEAWLRNLEPAMARLGVAGGRRLADAKREIPGT